MYNVEVAWKLQEIADLLEFKGDNYFKIRAYRNAARVIDNLPESVEELDKSGKLLEVPGIGKNIAAKIREMMETGDFDLHRRLVKEIPPSILEIMTVRGIGPKRARLLYRELNIASLDDLEQAAQKRKIRKLPGFGAKLERDILSHVKGYKNNVGRFTLGDAYDLSVELVKFLEHLPIVKKVSLGGSLRRWRETVADVDIVLLTRDNEALKNIVAEHPMVREVLDTGNSRIEYTTAWRIPVDISFAGEESYWTDLLWNTGNREHYNKLQNIAREMGLSLDRTGLYKGKVRLDACSEVDIYRHLGLPYIEPELREDKGEIEAALAGTLPVLIETKDIVGDLHVHTKWSDGINSIEDMALKAREIGYQYIAITDHSRSLKIANGLSIKKILKQFKKIERLNEELDGIKILTGTEVDILADGSLDFPDEILERADLVVASVHSSFSQDRETMTGRVIAAARNKYVDIIGHPTGRILIQREPYDIDMERLIEEASKCGVAIEINSSPERLDMNDRYARIAAEAGVKVAVNTDAHDFKRLGEMRYGVAVARRAWLTADNVINTLNFEELKDYLETHKRG
ncbi:MAG TPA: DNA polymerase/3'-5' exonuclease PolX [Clostridia bacterium]|nr:DNA polymerase/3'-5' exonuclease PolX [Clostridia bacterium]